MKLNFQRLHKFEYEDLYTYRAVERNWDDNRPVSLEDFKSYFELGKKPKRPRGVGEVLRRIHTIMVFPVSWIEE